MADVVVVAMIGGVVGVSVVVVAFVSEVVVAMIGGVVGVSVVVVDVSPEPGSSSTFRVVVVAAPVVVVVVVGVVVGVVVVVVVVVGVVVVVVVTLVAAGWVVVAPEPVVGTVVGPIVGGRSVGGNEPGGIARGGGDVVGSGRFRVPPCGAVVVGDPAPGPTGADGNNPPGEAIGGVGRLSSTADAAVLFGIDPATSASANGCVVDDDAFGNLDPAGAVESVAARTDRPRSGAVVGTTDANAEATPIAPVARTAGICGAIVAAPAEIAPMKGCSRWPRADRTCGWCVRATRAARRV